jgi:toxin-antitoxin system PIN domain toxin
MIALLDVNALVALAWPNHIHHQAAHAWFGAHRADGWATCPVTQAGFVRVSSNARVLPVAKSPREAFAVLESMTNLPDHRFFLDDVDLSRTPYVCREKILGYRQVTDAHLLAIALRHGALVATFDGGMRHLVSPEQTGAVLNIPR